MEVRLKKQFTIEPCEPDNTELAMAKSQGKSDGNGQEAKRGWVEGWATVETMDTDGDITRAAGGHHELILSKGYFQYEHPSLCDTIVGRPVSMKVGTEPISGKPGVLTRGFFYRDDPMGEKLFQKSQMLARNEPDDPLRRVGMSGEGKGWGVVPYTEEPGGRYDIRQWRLHSIAITHRPKVETALIPGDQIVDIAASILASEGNLDELRGELAQNRALVKSLLGDQPDTASMPALDMVHEAAITHSVLAGLCDRGVAEAESVGDAAGVDLLGKRAAAHSKAAWMLFSTVGTDAPKVGAWASKSAPELPDQGYLKLILSRTIALRDRTQLFHWNVTGPLFPSLHSLFGDQYAELAEATDALAERLRQTGLKVEPQLGSFVDYAMRKHGLTRSQAIVLVERTQELLA